MYDQFWCLGKMEGCAEEVVGGETEETREREREREGRQAGREAGREAGRDGQRSTYSKGGLLKYNGIVFVCFSAIEN